jgi:hypothetical protein
MEHISGVIKRAVTIGGNSNAWDGLLEACRSSDFSSTPGNSVAFEAFLEGC